MRLTAPAVPASPALPAPFDERVAGMVRRKAFELARLREFRGCDWQDLCQELALKVWKSRTAFDPARACWHGFASVVIARHAYTLVRDRRTALRNRPPTASLDACVAGQDGGPVSLSRVTGREALDRRRGVAPRPFTAAVDAALDVADLQARLPADLGGLAEQLKHAPLAAIARARARPRSTLQHHVFRLREFFQAHGLGDGS